MKQKLYIATLIILLIFPGVVLAAEKSVIVGFKQKPGPAEQALIHGAKGIIKRTYQIIPAMAVRLSGKAIKRLKKNDKIAYIEENALYTLVQPLPGDEYENSWGVFHIFADIAHASGNKGAGVRVAVLDTGIDYTHPDLDDNFAGGYDFVYDDNDPMDDSFNSHGTHVAGIIAAEENGIGVIGVAPEADLYGVKVLAGSGFGTTDWVIAGIDWAVANGIDIINLSLEGQDSQGLQDACDAAYDAGVLLVAAGGNSLAGGGFVEYPAAYGSVMAVTATDASDMPGFFSPVGGELELAAPGVDVLSTVAGGSYEFLSGTSQAAPHAAGTAALYMSTSWDENGNGMVNDEIRTILQETSIDLGDAGKDEIYGFGLVNAAPAASPDNIPFILTRTPGSPALDAETVYLAGVPATIFIRNSGLSRVKVDVYEGEVLDKDLSGFIRFNRKGPQEVDFTLDATGTRYIVIFTPYGKSQKSAEIEISLSHDEE